MVQLGVPTRGLGLVGMGGRYGVTECVEKGGREGWEEGRTWTVGAAGSGRGSGSGRRVGELEWGVEGRNGEKVVWLAAYDGEKHGGA